jgi:CysZ protein
VSAPAPRRVGFKLGMDYYWRGLCLLGAPGIRAYALVPTLVGAVLCAVGFYWATQWIDTWIADYLPPALQWLGYLVWPLLALVGAALIFFGLALLANLIASPFNGLLSAAVERQQTGRLAPSATRPWLAEVRASVGSELRKFRYFALLGVAGLLLMLIPGLLVFAPLLCLMGSAWMLAIEYLDGPLSNHGRGYPAARKLLSQHGRMALGFGAACTLVTLVPLLNFVAMPAGVIGATLMYLEQFADTDH